MVARDAARRAELFPTGQQQQQQQRQQQSSAAPRVRPLRYSIIVPVLNEEEGLGDTLHYLQRSLDPPAHEIIVVDGGSTDATPAVAARCGVRVVRAGRGRARQMNAGAAMASGDVLVFAHADTRPPPSLLTVVAAALARPAVVLGGFRPVIEYEGRPLRFFSANNTLKTYYGPALVRPLSFLRGLRCLFGDQTLFCRATDFKRVGGYDSRLPIMEDADLCIRLHMAGPTTRPGRRGQVVQITSVPNHTSGRRLASWGRVHATAIHVVIGLSWYVGASPQQLVWLYHRLYTDFHR
ncbi:glycosyl transferase [Micractinium conductrix]|uniref:Glycosyl transferase n=1 Tax=Micractinium conductrix TaxID=554055 RepID=A0A2P6VLD8_9CHLO|nr:glycosyl transferase [Micractinium conductrix]|eukprot:PSC74898.1 glycosyl transferase [Micractinium conductrix]